MDIFFLMIGLILVYAGTYYVQEWADSRFESVFYFIMGIVAYGMGTLMMILGMGV